MCTFRFVGYIRVEVEMASVGVSRALHLTRFFFLSRRERPWSGENYGGKSVVSLRQIRIRMFSSVSPSLCSGSSYRNRSLSHVLSLFSPCFLRVAGYVIDFTFGFENMGFRKSFPL